jgi:hypothetical protein
MIQRLLVGGFLVSLLMFTGCRSVYYSAWEQFGVHKRDLLKKKVVAARDDQKAASEQFKDALTRIKELYAFKGGELEDTYNELKKDYDRSVARADAVHSRIKDVETVAKDLFAEWEKELGEISSASLRASSKNKLVQTRARYEDLITALKRAEQTMDPVLTRFKDQVLFLKHNLNASAIASLKGESLDIQNEISKLLDEMNGAITRADKFIAALE